MLALILPLAACGNKPMDRTASANGAVADLIATVDGCRVWRIGGEVYDVYMARCPEGAADMENSVTEGKTPTR